VSEDGKAWLDQLESTGRQAAETLEALRRERDELATRVEELAGQVEALEAAGGGGKGKGKAQAAEATAAGREERKEIRRRVQKLTERLEGLL
jgi:cell division septum initiation protein DivIVA